MRTRLIPLLLLALLSGCGFRPLYGTTNAVGADGRTLPDMLAHIEVRETADRLGQAVRNELIGVLTPRGLAGAPRYALELSVDETLDGYAFRGDRAITRQRLTLEAKWRLVDLARGEPVLEETSEAWTAYDVVQSDFANLSAQGSAEVEATARLAERILSRIASHFGRGGEQ
ncbi:MAG: LPS assembly lipoprotein LptE [Rhodothalassiaceae bacterium]